MTAAVTGSAGAILRLGNAFCDAQTLLTAVELDLFSVLHDGPATEEDLRVRLALHGRGLRDFLRLLVRLDLLVEDNGRYRNAAATEDHLVAGAPGDVTGFLRGAKANLYPVWDGLTETLRSGLPRAAAENFAQMLGDPHQLRRYSEMMNGVLQPLIPRLLDALDWSDHRSVLDVGGCQGSLVGRLVDAHPGLTGGVFDLPQLQPVFNARMAELGTGSRVQFQAGDFFRDPLPRADVVILGHILHNWRREQREYLVSQAFRAVNPGGVLLVHDRMLADECPRIENLVASLTMALVTEQGSEYPVSELTSIALAAGFTSVTSRALDDNETLVLCRKAWAKAGPAIE
jgi:SAM-dependent methyltransferase